MRKLLCKIFGHRWIYADLEGDILRLIYGRDERGPRRCARCKASQVGAGFWFKDAR